MSDPQVFLEGVAFGESARWHDGRLWSFDWGAPEVVAVDEAGSKEVTAGSTSLRSRCVSASRLMAPQMPDTPATHGTDYFPAVGESQDRDPQRREPCCWVDTLLLQSQIGGPNVASRRAPSHRCSSLARRLQQRTLVPASFRNVWPRVGRRPGTWRPRWL
jgi:hypothetical protein